MKKIYSVYNFALVFCLTLFVAVSFQAMAQFTQIHSSNPNYTFHSIDFKNHLEGFAAGQDGRYGMLGGIFKTTDGGLTWSNLYGFTDSIYMQEIRIIDDSVIMALGGPNHTSHLYSYIFRSEDFGATWDTSLSSDFILEMDFTSADTGYYVSILPIQGSTTKEYYVHKTTDGGVTWNNLGLLCAMEPLVGGMEFISGNEGIITTGNYVRRTTNGGLTWDSTYIQNLGNCEEISYATDNTVYLTYLRSLGSASSVTELYKSIDGGVTFNYVSDVPTTSIHTPVNFVNFPTDSVGYVGRNLSVFRTVDGGQTWVEPTNNTSVPFRNHDDVWDACFLNADTGWLMMSFLLYHTTNGTQPLSVDNVAGESSAVSVYPNPTNNWIQIDFEKTLNARIEVLSLDGKIIHQQSNRSTNSVQISFADLNPGIYVVRIHTDDGTEVIRIVKQ